MNLFSPGIWAVLIIMVLSSAGVALQKVQEPAGRQYWVSAPQLHQTYLSTVADWNRRNPDSRITMTRLSSGALERRVMSGFLAGTPTADLIEVQRYMAGRTFSGPLESVGWLDLTERLHEEGIYEQINEPSFSLWTSRGHIFGLPHDVHPVLLAYRADLVEAAGIDVSQIETWDDYFRLLRPLMQDLDGDGRVDRYLINAWETDDAGIETLFLQADGRYFDENDRPTLNRPRNAWIISRLVCWFAGPNRVATEVPHLFAAGYQMRLRGVVVGSLMPDWMSRLWKREMPTLSGKIKLMPLPAWEKGGRRTSVWGGTMLGIAKRSGNIEDIWRFAKQLYLSKESAERLYRQTGIISPVKTFWNESFYAEPDPYYSGQAIGRLYIEQAPHIPRRPSSPFSRTAEDGVVEAIIRLKEYAIANNSFDPERLEPEALRLLEQMQAEIIRQISHNPFHPQP
jgi:arabinosaccharide transport system substrate-binding protein